MAIFTDFLQFIQGEGIFGSECGGEEVIIYGCVMYTGLLEWPELIGASSVLNKMTLFLDTGHFVIKNAVKITWKQIKIYILIHKV